MYYTSWSTCSHQPWSENNWENHSPNSSTNLQIGKSSSPINKRRLSHWPINVAKSYFGRHMPHVWKKQCMPEKQTPSQQEKEPFWNCHGQSPHAQQSNSKLLFTNVHNHTQQTHKQYTAHGKWTYLLACSDIISKPKTCYLILRAPQLQYNCE